MRVLAIFSDGKDSWGTVGVAWLNASSTAWNGSSAASANTKLRAPHSGAIETRRSGDFRFTAIMLLP